jgi:hypothetical protein
MRPILKFVFLLALLLAVVFPLALQYQTGSIEGIVSDWRGPLKAASLEVRNLASGDVVRVEADAKGHYEVPRLRAGRYSLWVEAGGHESQWILEVFVERGKATRRDILLVPRSLVT